MKKKEINGQLDLFAIIATTLPPSKKEIVDDTIKEISKEQLTEPLSCGSENDILDEHILNELQQETEAGSVLHIGSLMRRFHISARKAEAYLKALPENKAQRKRSWKTS